MTGPTHVLCDKGKLVIQNRIDGSENFNRSWLDYKQGFGYPEKGATIYLNILSIKLPFLIVIISLPINFIWILLGDYWLGLEPMYRLLADDTYGDSNVSYGLDVDMWTSQGEHFIAR